MIELLSPAGSPEAVIAAVQNGADAVYLGLGGFNARRGAKNFTDEEFEKAVRYCHVRGCKVHVALNTLVDDRELENRKARLRRGRGRAHCAGSRTREGDKTFAARHPHPRQHPDEHT